MQNLKSDNDQQCFKPHESGAKNVLLTSGEILSPISGRRVITDDSCDYFITVVIIIMTVIVLLMIIVVIITITKF